MGAIHSLEAALKAENMKYRLIQSISNVYKGKGLKQRDVADILGLSQPRVSNLVNCNLNANFSMESLIAYAIMLGIKVELSLT